MSAVEQSAPVRPVQPVRPDYVARSGPELFIVPLLKARIERAIAEHARPAAAPGRAIDVGCGRQPFRHTLEAAGYAYRGLDAVAYPDVPPDFVQPIDQPLGPEPRQEAPFDLVLCTEVLEHVGDWAVAFANLRDLTAPGGRVILTCPHVFMLHEEPFDFWRATPYAIRLFAERHGFTVVALEQLGSPGEAVATLLGSCTFRAARGGRLGYLFARSMNVVKRVLVRVITFRWLRWAAVLTGGTYLANFAVLERAPGSPAVRG
jgi:SAM-dependent methyltransferase